MKIRTRGPIARTSPQETRQSRSHDEREEKTEPIRHQFDIESNGFEEISHARSGVSLGGVDRDIVFAVEPIVGG